MFKTEINDEDGEDLDEEIDLEALMEKVRVEGTPKVWLGRNTRNSYERI